MSNVQIITVQDDVVGSLSKLLTTATQGVIPSKGTWYGGTIAWGLERVFLAPSAGTDTLGRNNFSIHGGDQYGSAGCIDLGHNEVDFFRTLTNLGIANISLNVDYDPSLLTLAHPLAGTFLPTGPLSRGLFPTDHLGNPIETLRPGIATLSSDADEFANVFGHSFSGSQEDIGRAIEAVADGRIAGYSEYVDITNNDRYLASFDNNPNKIVFSGDSNSSTIATVSSGVLQHITALPVDGTCIDTAFAPDGGQIETIKDLPNKYGWDHQVVSKEPGGAEASKVEIDDNNAVASATYNGVQFAGEIGGVLGSNIGRYLGGNSLVGQLAGSTVMGAFGKEIATALTMGASFDVELALENAFGTLVGGDGIGSLPAGGIGFISSLLMSELADALDLHGFEGGLFQTVGTTVTNQLITNAYGMVTGATYIPTPGADPVPYTMFSGFDTGAIFTQLQGAVGGFLGSTLAAHIVLPQSPEGAAGQQIGTSIGSFLGTLVLPGFGSALGAFVGGAFGTFIGDLFAPESEAHGDLQFDPATHHFIVDNNTYGQVRSTAASAFYQIAHYQADVVNGFADFAGAQLEGIQSINTPFGTIDTWAKLHFKLQGMTYTLGDNLPLPFYTSVALIPHNALDPMADAGIMQLVHDTHILGGDPLMRFAWDHSQATCIT